MAAQSPPQGTEIVTDPNTKQPTTKGKGRQPSATFRKGYSAALSDIRRVGRVMYGRQSERRTAINDVADALEDEIDGGGNADSLVQQLRSESTTDV